MSTYYHDYVQPHEFLSLTLSVRELTESDVSRRQILTSKDDART